MDTLKNDPRVAGWDHICPLGRTCTICQGALITKTPWSDELGVTASEPKIHKDVTASVSAQAAAELLAMNSYLDDTKVVLR